MKAAVIYPIESDLCAIDIHQLLPQQEPFVMVGKLVKLDEKLTVTETFIDENNLFVENNRFPPSGLIENIAQTCAARIGYINKYILKTKSLRIGLIGAVRNVEIMNTPLVGKWITTRMEIVEEVFDMILAKAEIVCDGRLSVVAEMKIAMEKEK